VDIFGDLKCVIKDDNAGDPGSTVTNGESNAIAGSTLGTAATDVTFTFSTPPSLTIAGDPYWFCIQGDSSNVGTLTIQVDTAGTGMKETNDNYSSFTASTGDMYYVIKEQDNAATVNGIFDYQLEASGSLSQKIVVAVGGSIYVKNGSSWDELKDTLASGQDAIYDFKTANNYMFSTDYANNNNRCWNGTTAGTTTQSTMDHGYRATFTATRTATGGTMAVGWYRVVAITQLKSGGYRASAPQDVEITAGTDRIVLSSIAMDSTHTEFNFDIDSLATTWFCTTTQTAQADLDGAILYKLDASDISVATNPIANSTTTFDITDDPAGTENTTLDEYGIEQGYFTSQVDTPDCKFLASGEGYLCMAGDNDNPSRLWVSPLNEPQVWGTFGGNQGTFYPVGNQNDGQIIRGVKFSQGAFFVFKDTDIYRFGS